jgi:hypothetical protein
VAKKSKMQSCGAQCTITLFLYGAFCENQIFAFCFYLVRSCTNKKQKNKFYPKGDRAGLWHVGCVVFISI